MRLGPIDHANLRSLEARLFGRQPPDSPRLRSSSCQHLLQFGELAGAVAPGDRGVDRLRRRRDRRDQLHALRRRSRPCCGADRPSAVRRSISRRASRSRRMRDRLGPSRKADPRQFRHLDAVDRSQRAQDPPLLLGQSVIAQRGAELPHHGLARAQQRHRQRAREIAHRHVPPRGLADSCDPDVLRAMLNGLRRIFALQQSAIRFDRINLTC